jgi:formyltetrahydrofolate deformylase
VVWELALAHGGDDGSHPPGPSLKGTRHYQQAYDRCVKLIGATAHYVAPDLDEGPIIEQAVTRMSHAMRAAHVTRRGRDNECLALSRGRTLVFE